MRILVVEDERTLAGFIEQALRAEGYAPTVVHDGDDGIAEALTGDYALVLLDLMLPRRTGLDVLDAIRARKTELPVIVVTAQAAIEQRVEGLDRGANDYVTKPFSFEELLARVRAQLRAPGQRVASVLEAGGVRIDLRTRRVEREGRQVRLTWSRSRRCVTRSGEATSNRLLASPSSADSGSRSNHSAPVTSSSSTTAPSSEQRSG